MGRQQSSEIFAGMGLVGWGHGGGCDVWLMCVEREILEGWMYMSSQPRPWKKPATKTTTPTTKTTPTSVIDGQTPMVPVMRACRRSEAEGCQRQRVRSFYLCTIGHGQCQVCRRRRRRRRASGAFRTPAELQCVDQGLRALAMDEP